MGFFKRISDIVSANLNDIAEEYEDPEKMLRQAIREMEQSIADATQQTAKVMANEKTLVRELERNRGQSAQWQGRAEQAVESGDDELARKALTRRREHDKLVSALEDQLTEARDASAALRRQLEGMKAKLSEARRNLTTLAARKRAADFRKARDSQATCESFDLDDNAFSRFDRLKAKVEQAEAEAEAMSELRGLSAVAEDEPADATDDSVDVTDELSALKRKLRK
jgi:phage shock protein A